MTDIDKPIAKRFIFPQSTILNPQSSIICLMGPTAAGKTALALKLAQQFPCEIISVDSGMIYRGMDIGTAKPSRSELMQVPHHLIDICDPAESYSVGRFRLDAIAAIEQILLRNKIPLLVGGTMMYFRMLQQGISKLPQANMEVRALLKARAEQFGWHTLYQQLQAVDPTTAARISATDTQRIQRALEIYTITGKTLSELQREFPPEPLPYEITNFALLPENRATIQQQIQLRLQKMLQQGFIAEVEQLVKRSDLHIDLPALRAVGYRQAWQYLHNKINYAEMCEQIQIATAQLAKRQMTWIRSWTNIISLVDNKQPIFTACAALV